MKVFTEWHHGGLFHSLQMMFEGRLGGELFAQVGYDWEENGYWNINDLPTTKIQYLNPDYCIKGKAGIPLFYDPSEEIFQKRITLADFKQTKFDVILCTLQAHQEPFRQLRDRYQPQAKLIRLCGNTGEQVNYEGLDGFIDTTGLYRPPENLPHVIINQEFPMAPFFWEAPKNHKTIKNYMNCLREAQCYPIWQFLKREMPDFDFKMHGSNGDDGGIVGLFNIGKSMRDAGFVFQVKHQGEGFGHIIHNAYASGRPIIGVYEYYAGKLASKFLINDYSAILLDDLTPPEVIKKIKYWSEPERHLTMCQNAYKLFKDYVSFDEDEKKFRTFLGQVM